MSSESHIFGLQALFKVSALYRISTGIQYIQYSIQNSPLDSTNRHQDFIRYNQLFQPNAGAIIIGGFFKQSDIASFFLKTNKYTFNMKHSWHFNKIRLSISHPITLYLINTQLKKTTLTIPTTMFGSTTISDSLDTSGSGFVITSPLAINAEYSFSKITLGLEATQIIPMYNNFTIKSKNDTVKQGQDQNQKMAKNGFYLSIYLKLSF